VDLGLPETGQLTRDRSGPLTGQNTCDRSDLSDPASDLHYLKGALGAGHDGARRWGRGWGDLSSEGGLAGIFSRIVPEIFMGL
jgi:hypothetical protein